MQNTKQTQSLSLKQKIITLVIFLLIIGVAIAVVALVFKVTDALIDAQPMPLERFESQSVEILVSNKTDDVFKIEDILLSKDMFFFIRYEKDAASLNIAGDGSVSDRNREQYIEIPSVDVLKPVEVLRHFLQTALPDCSVKNVGLSDIKDVLVSNDPSGLMVSLESKEIGNSSSSLYVISFKEGQYHITVTESTENYIVATPTHVRRGLDRYTCIVEYNDPFIDAVSTLISQSVQ